MNTEKRRPLQVTAREKNKNQETAYYITANESREIYRAERIRKHRADIPKIHHRIYDRAMQGKSLKSAVKSFCLECVCWQKEEVRHCTSLICPLYPYRPYKEKSKQASQRLVFGAESQNSGTRILR